jgi:hypothetical protein
MDLKTSCDNCGRTFLGIATSLKNVNGRYLCPACLANPEGVPRYYCAPCNTYFPNKGMKGSGWIEFVLYLCYIVPGIIYSIWRRSGSAVCPKCKSATLIAVDAGTHVKCPDCRELVLKDARKCKHCGCALVPQ